MPTDHLAGNFAPITDELDEHHLTIRAGALPPDLAGTLLRIGPNPVDADPDRYSWFTGDGMVHAVELDAGVARAYRNRWVRTVHAAEALGEDPPSGGPEPYLTPDINRANTSVIAHHGRLLALYESCQPTQITPALDTIGPIDFDGRLPAAMTAHPKIDPATGDMWSIGVDLLEEPWLWLHVTDRDGEMTTVQPITLDRASVMHDFALTESSVVFYDLPAVYDLELLAERPFPATWDPEHAARVGVLARGADVTSIRWVDIEPRYVFHTVNAWDHGDVVVVEVIAYDHMFKEHAAGIEAARPRVERWTIHPDATSVSLEIVDDREQEFPIVNASLSGRKNRYRYSVDTPGASTAGPPAVLKTDIDRGVTTSYDLDPHQAPSEAVFVPAGDGTNEDDGWLLTVVHDTEQDRSELHVLDATDPSGPADAVVELPQRVPFGFHGCWVATP